MAAVCRGGLCVTLVQLSSTDQPSQTPPLALLSRFLYSLSVINLLRESSNLRRERESGSERESRSQVLGESIRVKENHWG